jgi:hypothetical protein
MTDTTTRALDALTDLTRSPREALLIFARISRRWKPATVGFILHMGGYVRSEKERRSFARMTRDRDTFDMFNPRIRGRFAEDEDRDFDAKPTEVKKSKLIDLDMVLHAETHPGKSEQGAILVSDTGDENAAKWIPKSLCKSTTQARPPRAPTKPVSTSRSNA